jgi:hypothetical protein
MLALVARFEAVGLDGLELGGVDLEKRKSNGAHEGGVLYLS